jgi:hypothetical protein
MRRVLMMAVGVISMVSMVAAQKLEVGIDGGYGLPAGTFLVGHNTIIDTNTYGPKTVEELYSPGGKGWKITGEVVYYPLENLGIIVISGYSMNNRYDTIYAYENKSSMITDTVTTSHIPLNIGVKIKTKIGIAEPYVYVAPGVIFPKKTENSWNAGVTIKRTYSYSMGFCVTAGIGAAIMVTDKIGIRAEFTPTYAFASPTQYKEEQTYLTIGNIPTTTTRIIKYVDNKPLSDLNADEIQNRPHDSFCSMAFKIGLCLKLF